MPNPDGVAEGLRAENHYRISRSDLMLDELRERVAAVEEKVGQVRGYL
jgi:hypothetical protein